MTIHGRLPHLRQIIKGILGTRRDKGRDRQGNKTFKTKWGADPDGAGALTATNVAWTGETF